jgi:hypothetical protein
MLQWKKLRPKISMAYLHEQGEKGQHRQCDGVFSQPGHFVDVHVGRKQDE